MSTLEVRPFAERSDYLAMIDYFTSAAPAFLRGMGVDPDKMPSRAAWLEAAWRDHQLAETDPRRERFFVGWYLDGELIGHSSINKIKWGEEAYIHLHMWQPDRRKSGVGTEFFRKSIDFFLERFQLDRLYCEPYAENPAPNRVLQKLGYTPVKRYRTIPGPINFEQEVNRYEITKL